MTGNILENGYSSESRKGLGYFFFDAANIHGNKTCQIDGDTGASESFLSVKLRSIRVALELQKRGITQNDTILCCLSNTLNSSIPVIAGFFIGAKISHVDPTQSARDCRHAISIVCPKVIFVDGASVNLIKEAIKDLDIHPQLVVVGEYNNGYRLPNFSEFLEPKDEEEDFEPVNANDWRDTAIIFFSSGTTGFPKAICISHYALKAQIESISKLDMYKPDVLLPLTTLYWISGGMLLVMSFAHGGHRILSSSLTPEKVLKFIEKYKITYIFMAPPFAYKLMNVPNGDQFNTSSLFSVTLGGCAIAPEQLKKFRNFLKYTHVCLGYGQTEASGFITGFSTKDKELYERKLKSSGKPAPAIQIKVVDPETEAVLGPNENGEIRYKTPFIMNGYYNQDASDNFDEDGFLKTGDIGYYDEDDCFYIIDRIKDMFKYQSWHVVPSSLEAILIEHPDVSEAVVFGVPHEEDGDRPAACVVLKENSTTKEDDILTFMSERVSDKQKLRAGVMFVDNIIKAPSGKVLRRKMRDMFLNTMK